MDFDYDIVIVGAGPAGLNAGYCAAKQGASVLILDKKKELGKPVRCAEAVVEDILIDHNIKTTKEIVSNYVNSLTCISSKGKQITFRSDTKGCILDRVKFEQFLGDRAEEQNAKIQLQTTVVGLNRKELVITKNNGKTRDTIKGKIIIAADGVESRIGRWAGIDTTLKVQDIAVCYQYLLSGLELDAQTVEFYWGRKYSPHGYIWVFPKSGASANVGIVTIGKGNKDLKSILDKFVTKRAPNSKKIRKTTGCVPQGMPPERLVKDNVVLIGDAARVAIPVTGAGIGNALSTGKWAGEIAGEIIADNLPIRELTRFEDQMGKIRKKIRRANRIKQKIVRDDDIFDLFFALLAPVPYLYKLSPSLIERFLLKNIRY